MKKTYNIIPMNGGRRMFGRTWDEIEDHAAGYPNISFIVVDPDANIAVAEIRGDEVRCFNNVPVVHTSYVEQLF